MTASPHDDSVSDRARGRSTTALSDKSDSDPMNDTPILSLGQSQNFAILFLMGVAFIIVVLLNFVALAFEISAFPFLEILGVIALLMLVIWSRIKALAAVAVLIFASTVMAPALFQQTYTTLVGGLGLQASSADPSEEASTWQFGPDPKGDAETLAEIDRNHLLHTIRLLNAVAAATPVELHAGDDPFPRRDVDNTGLLVLAGIVRSGFAQAEAMRASASYLVRTDLIDCTSQSGFTDRANIESRRMALAQELMSCRASVDGLRVAYRDEIANEVRVPLTAAVRDFGDESSVVPAGAYYGEGSWLDMPVTLSAVDLDLNGSELTVERDGAPRTLQRSVRPGGQAAIRISVPATATYSVRVRSEDGDPFIAVYLQAGDQLLKLDENDDFNGTDSGLDLQLQADAQYVLVVREYYQDPMSIGILLSPL